MQEIDYLQDDLSLLDEYYKARIVPKGQMHSERLDYNGKSREQSNKQELRFSATIRHKVLGLSLEFQITIKERPMAENGLGLIRPGTKKVLKPFSENDTDQML